MKTEQIIILVVAFFLGMLLLNMVKNVCGCGVVEGFTGSDTDQFRALPPWVKRCLLDSFGVGRQATSCITDFNELCDAEGLCVNNITSTWGGEKDICGRDDTAASVPQDITNGTDLAQRIFNEVKTVCNHQVESGDGPSYVLASNEGFTREADMSEDAAKEAVCSYLQSTTACSTPVGAIPETYYECMDGDGAQSEQCGDFGDFAGYVCDLTGNLPCPGTDSCPVDGCPQPLPPVPCTRGSWSCGDGNSDGDCTWTYQGMPDGCDATDSQTAKIGTACQHGDNPGGNVNNTCPAPAPAPNPCGPNACTGAQSICIRSADGSNHVCSCPDSLNQFGSDCSAFADLNTAGPGGRAWIRGTGRPRDTATFRDNVMSVLQGGVHTDATNIPFLLSRKRSKFGYYTAEEGVCRPIDMSADAGAAALAAAAGGGGFCFSVSSDECDVSQAASITR